MTIETKNAIIDGTMLGIEDHGVLTAYIYLDYGGMHQGFGGYAFDEWNPKLQRRVGGAYGSEFILRVLDTLKVGSWEKLKGVPCRVEAEHSKVHRIGHFIEERWFDPKDISTGEK